MVGALWAGCVIVAGYASAQDWIPEHATVIAKLSAVEVSALEGCKAEYLRQGRFGNAHIQCGRKIATPAEQYVKAMGLLELGGSSVSVPLCPDCKLRIAIYCRGSVTELSAVKGKKMMFDELPGTRMLQHALAPLGAELTPATPGYWGPAIERKLTDCIAILDPPKGN